ncbi:unnamed protein product [Parnassius apollo]|uniref:(apollo) hypothetical protein n=1 Tax=Parnassius apollo TaxID=110799 RepID=A0A8S3XPC2_PARAO|nr:unnamed protein product [Parnassius apollo]
METLAELNLEVVNTGKKPTFSAYRRDTLCSSIIDITACTTSLLHKIENWRVDDSFCTLSNHKPILFKFSTTTSFIESKINSTRKYNTRKANWSHFNVELKRALDNNGLTKERIGVIRTTQEIDEFVKTYTECITKACDETIPKIERKQLPKAAKWWNTEIKEKKEIMIRLRRRIRNAHPTRKNWVIEQYLQARKQYKESIEDATTKSWKELCTNEQKENVWQRTYRILKVCSNVEGDKLLKDQNGTILSEKGSATLLAETFYPKDNPNTDTKEQDDIRTKTNELIAQLENKALEVKTPFARTEIDQILSNMSPKKAPAMPATQGDPPALPATAEEVRDFDTFTSVINKLTSCVSSAINEGKSVTAVNKRLISLAMEEIRRAARTLNSVNTITSPSASALGEIKEEIVACVREEMTGLRKLVNTMKKPTYAQAVSAASGASTSVGGPAPRTVPTISKPAVIITPAKDVKTRQEAVELFRKSISYRNSTYAPTRVQPVSNNKLRVEFENVSQRDDTLTRLENSKDVKAEPVRMLKPMVILKGISKDVPSEDLVKLISKQNPEISHLIEGEGRDGEGLRLRFKRGNRNSNLYNAVFLAEAKVYRKILDLGRVCVDHQRITVDSFSPFLQCHKCLQFGHMRSKCTATESLCSHCAGSDHQVDKCPVKNEPGSVKCYNCTSHNARFKSNQDCKHTANSDKCPRLRAMKDKINQRVDYGFAP